MQRAEIVLGVATGGTYTAATLATKWGFTKFALHVAAELAVSETGALDRAVAPYVRTAMVLAEKAGLNPRLLAIGCQVLQATGVAKKFSNKLLGTKNDFLGQKPGRLEVGQTLGFDGNKPYRVLGRNMEKAGVKRPPSSTPHHIVAHNDRRADGARDILEGFDPKIDLNLADNGVFLPTNLKRQVPGVQTHSTVHTDIYFVNVEKRLFKAQAGGREAVRDALQKIREELSDGTFPIDKLL